MAARKGMSGVVRRICLWCQGKSWMRVRECAQSSCPLHSCRLLEDGEDGVLLECIRNFCLACAGGPEAVEECCADRPMGGQPACPAHPFRNGDGPPAVRQPACPAQQVRPLPGLGGICVEAVRQSALEDSPASETSRGEAPSTALAPLPRRDALSITHAERVPEAPDI
jgi:hypothetical protein